MIAGSDTTATALSAAMYYLVRDPEKLKILKEEIRGAFSSVGEIVSGKQLSDCNYLKACVDEAMRLAPPVPGLLPREVTAPEGITIDDVFLPQGVRIPLHFLNCDLNLTKICVRLLLVPPSTPFTTTRLTTLTPTHFSPSVGSSKTTPKTPSKPPETPTRRSLSVPAAVSESLSPTPSFD